jgi:hypothetical protein
MEAFAACATKVLWDFAHIVADCSVGSLAREHHRQRRRLMKVLSGRPRPGGGATWPPACPSPRRPRWICASTRSPQWARTQCAAARGIGRTQPRHRRTARNQRERCKVPCLETLLREAGAGLACRPPSGGGGLRPSAVSRGSKISPGFTTAPEEVSARALPMSARSCCFTMRSKGNRPCFQWPIIRSGCALAPLQGLC